MRTFVLCLDIDNTLINPETTNGGFFDFNGELDPIQIGNYYPSDKIFTVWDQLLTILSTHLMQQGIELKVHIITAKESGAADCTVDAVVRIFHEFLQPLDCHGNYYQDNMPEQYLYAKHHHTGITKIRMCNEVVTWRNDTIPLLPKDYQALPSIHVTYQNVCSNSVVTTSKAQVMRHINQELINRGKIPVGMILVDDNPRYADEVSRLGAKFICASALRNDKNPAILTPELRANIIMEIMGTITQHVWINFPHTNLSTQNF